MLHRTPIINRVSAFFLTALAIALLGYSLTLYLLVRHHLYGQFDEGLQNALRILAASVEVEPDDAKWQPGEFTVDLAALRDVMWIVSSESGQMIDHSPGLSRSDPQDRLVWAYSSTNRAGSTRPVELGQWRVVQKQLDAPEPKSMTLREPHEYSGVRITVARSPVPVDAQMRKLAFAVVGLPVVVWFLAAGTGRWYFRQALAPLQAMAARARSMKAADFELRLPIAAFDDELADLGNAFNDLLDQLQRAYDREHRFTASAAHQLGTPLTVMQGQIDVALRRPRKSTEYRQTLQVLAEQVTEFRQIVASLLFLARSEQDAIPAAFEPTAIGTWVSQYVFHWDEHDRRDDLVVHIETEAIALVSPQLLSQLMDNLIWNAFKYSEPGTPVELRASRDDGQLVLSVKDYGVGITSSDQSRIFEPFFRAQSARQAGISGTGLGLAVAARIAAALGASLECISTAGHGSTFRVILSCAPIDPEVAPTKPHSSK